MAPKQSILTKFLYGSGEGDEVDSLGNEINGLQFDTTEVEASGGSCNPPRADQSLQSPPCRAGSSRAVHAISEVEELDPVATSSAHELARARRGVGSKVEELDPTKASPAHDLACARRRGYERNRVWQDSWAARLPWAESVVSENGDVRQVRCKICTEVDGRDKLLVPKIDSLWKHASRRRALATHGKLQAGQFYFLVSGNAHVKNEKIYFAKLGRAECSIVQ